MDSPIERPTPLDQPTPLYVRRRRAERRERLEQHIAILDLFLQPYGEDELIFTLRKTIKTCQLPLEARYCVVDAINKIIEALEVDSSSQNGRKLLKDKLIDEIVAENSVLFNALYCQYERTWAEWWSMDYYSPMQKKTLFIARIEKGLPNIKKTEIRLGKKIGSGSFGEVYQAKWRSTDVAVKKCFGNRLPADIKEATLNEAHIMRQLSNKFLVSMYGLMENEGGSPWLVMEYCQKGSLYHFLASSESRSWTIRLRIAADILEGIVYLHNKVPPILHRDLKTSNVLLTSDNRAKLGDFGLSRLRIHSESTGTELPAGQQPAGSARYMDPELLSGRRHSLKSDVWAASMVLLALANRKEPYATQAVNNHAVIALLIRNPPVLPSISSECRTHQPGLADIMQRCWVGRGVRPESERLLNEVKQLQTVSR